MLKKDSKTNELIIEWWQNIYQSLRIKAKVNQEYPQPSLLSTNAKSVQRAEEFRRLMVEHLSINEDQSQR